MNSFLSRTLWILLITMMGSRSANPQGSSLSADEVAIRLSLADSRRAEEISGYEAIRTYVLDNSRLGQHAEMTVRATVRYPDNKVFQILSMSGPEWMRGAMRRILDGERGRADESGNERLRIRSGNYRFRNAKLVSFAGRDTYVVEIEPKTKADPLMLRGLLWVDAHDYAVAHFEGQMAGRVSFWAGTPLVTQSYKKLGSAWVPAANHSVSKSLLFGDTDLTVTFSEHVLLGLDRERADRASGIR